MSHHIHRHHHYHHHRPGHFVNFIENLIENISPPNDVFFFKIFQETKKRSVGTNILLIIFDKVQKHGLQGIIFEIFDFFF